MRLSSVWVLCLLASACARDPIDTPGTWKLPPKDLTSNNENLKAMLVNPRDLVSGRGESTSEGVTGAAAARRELSGRRAPLPNANVSLNPVSANQQQGQQNQQQGAGGSAGRTE